MTDKSSQAAPVGDPPSLEKISTQAWPDDVVEPEGEYEEGDYEEDNLPPEDGHVLEAGDYLIELATRRLFPREVLTEGFRRLGCVEILHDQSPLSTFRDPRAPQVHRFIARVQKPFAIRQRADVNVQWIYARKLATDVLAELKHPLKFEAHQLTEGKIYEARFFSRMRAQPTRPMVEKDLDEMGWEVLHLAALRPDTRIPGRDNASVTLWFGILRWEEVDSPISEDDPFFFEQVI